MKRLPLFFLVLLLSITAGSCEKRLEDIESGLGALQEETLRLRENVSLLMQQLASQVPVTFVSLDGDLITVTFANGVRFTVTPEPQKPEDNYIHLTAIEDTPSGFVFHFTNGLTFTARKTDRNGILSERTSGNLAPGEITSLTETFIRKNTVLSAELRFDTFDRVELGRGRDRYVGFWVELTPDKYNIMYHNYDESDRFMAYGEHGLTLESPVTVSVEVGTGSGTLRIISGGKLFEKEIPWKGGGAPFIRNTGSTPVSYTMSFLSEDTARPVWIFGDSYTYWYDPTLWPYWIHQRDYENYLIDSLPGAKSETMLESFLNDLKFGTPTFAVWTLGMNETPDTDTADADYVKHTQAFLETCRQKGITPILTTTPSVPKRNHRLISEWVRGSGCRYIDLSAAVSAGDSPDWMPGLLDTDEIHPTEAGARVLAARVLLDFPEIACK